MRESIPRNEGRGKAQRVSQRRELAVVTLAAVASISGVGGLLAVGQHTSDQLASAPRSAVASPAQPRSTHRPLTLTQASYRGEDGEEVGDDDGVILRSAKRTDTGRRSGNVAWSPTTGAHPSAVSQGSAPVN